MIPIEIILKFYFKAKNFVLRGLRKGAVMKISIYLLYEDFLYKKSNFYPFKISEGLIEIYDVHNSRVFLNYESAQVGPIPQMVANTNLNPGKFSSSIFFNFTKLSMEYHFSS
jgi:hypothetical protein